MVTTTFTIAGTIETFDQVQFIADLLVKFPGASNITIKVSPASIIVETKLAFDNLANAQAAKEALRVAVDNNDFAFITGAEVESATTPLLDVPDSLKPVEEEGDAMVPLMVTIVVLLIVALVGVAICGAGYLYRHRKERERGSSNVIIDPPPPNNVSPQRNMSPSMESGTNVDTLIAAAATAAATAAVAAVQSPGNGNFEAPRTPIRSPSKENIGVDTMTPFRTPTPRSVGHTQGSGSQTSEVAVQVSTPKVAARSGPRSRLGKYLAYARAMSPKERTPGFKGWNSIVSPDAIRRLQMQNSDGQLSPQQPLNRWQSVSLEHGLVRSRIQPIPFSGVDAVEGISDAYITADGTFPIGPDQRV